MKHTRFAQFSIIFLGVFIAINDAHASGTPDGWAGLALLILVIGSGIPAIVVLALLTYLCVRARRRGRVKPVLGNVTIVLSILAILSVPGFLFFGIVFDYMPLTTWGFFATGCLLWSPVIILGIISALQGRKVMRSVEQ